MYIGLMLCPVRARLRPIQAVHKHRTMLARGTERARETPDRYSEANTEPMCVRCLKRTDCSFTVMLLLLPERLNSENWRWLKVSHHW